MIFSLNRPLILIGMPGCGKTALGRIVAEKLGLPFLDIDKCIFEQTGKDSAEHLRSKGDQGFLKFEGQITESLDIRNKIIASSGSSLLDENGLRHFKKFDSIMVFLDVSREVLRKRIAHRADGSSRIVGAETMSLIEIYMLRKKTYEENCDIYLKVSREAPKEVNAGRIIDGLEKYLQNEQS